GGGWAGGGGRGWGGRRDAPAPADRKTVALGDIAIAVRRLTNADLTDALAALGHAPAGRREAALAHREATRRRREALDVATERHLGAADWVGPWRDAIWSDGLLAHREPREIDSLVAGVSRVLEAATGERRRTEGAAP